MCEPDAELSPELIWEEGDRVCDQGWERVCDDDD